MTAAMVFVMGTWLLVGTLFVCIGALAYRRIILSGYPAYPITALSVPVPRKVPIAATRLEAEAVTGWARAPGPTYLASLSTWTWIAFFAPVVIGIVAWFLTAPDPRFADALFWSAAAGTLACAFPSFAWPARVAMLVLASELVLAVNPSAAVAALRPVKPGPAGVLYRLPAAPLRVFTTSSGLHLYVPVVGDQTWDAPLPSTPYPDRSLRLRCKDTLRCGFIKA